MSKNQVNQSTEKSKIYCLHSSRTGHHQEYFKVLSKLAPIESITVIKKKIPYLFKRNALLLLDIDNYDLLFFPLLMLRQLFAQKSFAISVRAEDLLNVTKYSRRKIIVNRIKQILFYCLKNYSNIELISIHQEEKQILDKYFNYFINDIQLWDLPYLETKEKKPKEIDEIDLYNYILIPGRLNLQKSPNELINYCKQGSMKFIISGNIDSIFLKELINFSNVFIINRFCDDQELLYLYRRVRAIYCFYPFNISRPSGFFGRALQLNKPIIVRSKGYLDRNFGKYQNIIALKELREIETLDFTSMTSNIVEFNKDWDDSYLLKHILTRR